MLKRLLCVGVLLVASVAGPGPAWAQDQWKALVDKAKGQTLAIVHQPNPSVPLILAEFSKKFGITVEPTVARPSSALARMRTEQQNGQFVWDAWLGGTSNMVNTASPAGMLEALEPHMVLPEVKGAANWRHPDFMYGDAAKRVFTHLTEVNYGVLRNTSVLPELKIARADDFLNPRLKGKISMRDASVPNFGTFALATFYKQKGPEFLAKLLKTQDVKIFENPQQLEAAITRGGQAIAIGLESSIWETCRKAGGCTDVEQLKSLSMVNSWGVSMPKSPPHPQAAEVWLNWFLSKEGQEVAVREWAKHNPNGALSLRKDVKPAPGHEQYLPDFANPDQYVFVSSEKGSEEIKATIKLFKDAMGR